MSRKLRVSKKIKKDFLYLLPFAYLLFRFYLVPVSNILQKLILYGFLIGYIALNKHMIIKKSVFKYFLAGLATFLCIMLFAYFIQMGHGTRDLSYVRAISQILIDYLCYVCFTIHIKKRAKDREDDEVELFTNEYCKIIILYVSFTIFCIVIPAFKTWYKQFVPITEYQINHFLIYQKYIGRFSWNGFAGYASTMKCTIGVLLILNELLKKKSKEKNEYKYAVYLMFCLLGNVFYGRIGLVCSAVALAIFLIRELIIRGKVLLFLKVIVAVALGIVISMVLASRNSTINSLFNWVFEFILNYLGGEGFVSTSTNALMGMFRKPSFDTMLLGDGYYADPIREGGYYMSTDIGYFRLIYYWGLIPTIVVYCLTIESFKKGPFPTKSILIIFIVFFALFETKGGIYKEFLALFLAMGLLRFEKRKIIKRGSYYEDNS